MQKLTVNIPDNLADLFGKVCLGNNKVQEEIIAELVTRYIEDIEDSADIKKSQEANFQSFPIEDVRKELGL